MDNIKHTKNKKEVKKLGDTKYIGPKNTFQSMLTPQNIIDLLDGFEEISYTQLKKGFNIRYFSKDNDGILSFKTGGVVLLLELPTYIICSNNNTSWSIQINEDTVFFQQSPISSICNEIENKYKEQLFKKETELQEYTVYTKKLYIENKQLKNDIIDKNNEIEKLNKIIKKLKH